MTDEAIGGDLESYYGLTIEEAELKEDDTQYLLLTFSDSIRALKLYDNGQSCCESRYITTDDELSSLIGGKLLRIEVKKVESKDDAYDVHEQAFVEIATDKGFVTLVTHNEHNGYYGGFMLRVEG